MELYDLDEHRRMLRKQMDVPRWFPKQKVPPQVSAELAMIHRQYSAHLIHTPIEALARVLARTDALAWQSLRAAVKKHGKRMLVGCAVLGVVFWLLAVLGHAQQTTIRGVAKGTTPANSATVTSTGPNNNAQDVNVVALPAGTNNIGAVTIANLPSVQSVKLLTNALQPIPTTNQSPIVVVQLSNGTYLPVQLVQGQAVMAQSLPVTLASNQSALPVTGAFFQTTQPVSVSGNAAVTGVGADNNAHPLATDGAGNQYVIPVGLPKQPCNAVRTTNCQHF